jgi:hypothetical protein
LRRYLVISLGLNVFFLGREVVTETQNNKNSKHCRCAKVWKRPCSPCDTGHVCALGIISFDLPKDSSIFIDSSIASHSATTGTFLTICSGIYQPVPWSSKSGFDLPASRITPMCKFIDYDDNTIPREAFEKDAISNILEAYNGSISSFEALQLQEGSA